MTKRAHTLFTNWCYFVAFAFASMKWVFAYRWWFDGVNFMSVAFRPFPDWGTGANLYGALLPAKWIGTRNFCYGLLIYLAIFFGRRYRKNQFLGFLLLQGVLIEFFDGLWLANGKYNEGWVGPQTDFYMIGGFLWFPFLLSSGMYLVAKELVEKAQSAK